MIDCCVHHAWSSGAELVDYLPAGWRDYVAANVAPAWRDHLHGIGERPAGPLVYPPLMPSHPYPHPDGDKAPGAGTGVEALAREHLDAHGIELALLCGDPAMLTPALPQPRLAVEVTRAANRWTVERWLERDPRLHGAIVIPNQLPDKAAEEIHRAAAAHPRMVAVLMTTNGLGKPFGHPAYEPIYAAAAEHGLTLVLHAWAEAFGDGLELAAAAGPSATFGEYFAMLPQTQMAHVTSLISQGVLERHRGLRVLLLGAGAAWIAPFLWRFDSEYHAMRQDAPWLRRLPSECFREHFRVGTYPLDWAPTSAQLARYYAALGGLEDLLCFASGYPNWNGVTPAEADAALPAAWHERVRRANPLALLRWEQALTASGG